MIIMENGRKLKCETATSFIPMGYGETRNDGIKLAVYQK